jgi:hypothetical protein
MSNILSSLLIIITLIYLFIITHSNKLIADEKIITYQSLWYISPLLLVKLGNPQQQLQAVFHFATPDIIGLLLK